MANVLSEPALPNCASRSEEVLLEKTAVPMSQLALEAKAAAEANPHDPELWIKYGRALRRQMMHREAIAAYCMGLSYNPFYPLLYRHRAHAYINIGEYTASAATFEIALRLDPSNWDCWYHQGVAYYLSGQYERAEVSFRGCFGRSDLFDDDVATKDWLWLTLMRLGKEKEAAEVVADIKPGHAVQYADCGYYNRVLVYNGTITPEEAMEAAGKGDGHLYATASYGIACYYLFHGEKAKAYDILKKIDEDSSWGGFAEHAGRRDFAQWQD